MGQKYAKGRSQNIRVHGLENVAAAREAGKGTVLWLCPFTYMFLIAKMGLHQEGIEISHLSREGHGFGRSRVAVRFLNRHWVDGENLYVKERLVMIADNETGALRALRQCLKDNGIVSITLSKDGRKRASTPFLSGSLTVATGALGLAVSTGAAILPVYTLRNDDGGFDVTVDRPLEPGPEAGRDAQFEHLVKDLAARLTRLVTRHPEQWADWNLLSASE